MKISKLGQLVVFFALVGNCMFGGAAQAGFGNGATANQLESIVEVGQYPFWGMFPERVYFSDVYFRNLSWGDDRLSIHFFSEQHRFVSSVSFNIENCRQTSRQGTVYLDTGVQCRSEHHPWLVADFTDTTIEHKIVNTDLDATFTYQVRGTITLKDSRNGLILARIRYDRNR